MKRLSVTLGGVREPQTCQKCRRTAAKIKETGGYLELWNECDDNDEPTGIVVFLCVACNGDPDNICPDRDLIASGQVRRRKKGLIEAHERLYIQLDVKMPMPGLMWLCEPCKHRDGLCCTWTEDKTIEIDSPARICGRSGPQGMGKAWTTLAYPNPARRCSAWESLWGEEFVSLPETTREERVEEWRRTRRSSQEADVQKLGRELSPPILNWLDARADFTRGESEI